MYQCSSSSLKTVPLSPLIVTFAQVWYPSNLCRGYIILKSSPALFAASTHSVFQRRNRIEARRETEIQPLLLMITATTSIGSEIRQGSLCTCGDCASDFQEQTGGQEPDTMLLIDRMQRGTRHLIDSHENTTMVRLEFAPFPSLPEEQVDPES
jgi:hypothetical protein